MSYGPYTGFGNKATRSRKTYTLEETAEYLSRVHFKDQGNELDTRELLEAFNLAASRLEEGENITREYMDAVAANIEQIPEKYRLSRF